MTQKLIQNIRIGFWIAFFFFFLFFLVEDLHADVGANNFGLKVGYHNFVHFNRTQYPDDDGRLEDGEIDFAVHGEDFNGVSFDVEYYRRLTDWFSVALSGGAYGGETKFDTTVENREVSGRFRIWVTSILLTPKIHLLLESVDLYTGAGLGIYFLDTDFRMDVEGEDESTEERQSDQRNKLGYHAIIGAEWLLAKHWGIFLEDRYAFAVFKGGNHNTDMDNIDAGGNNILLGVRFRF